MSKGNRGEKLSGNEDEQSPAKIFETLKNRVANLVVDAKCLTGVGKEVDDLKTEVKTQETLGLDVLSKAVKNEGKFANLAKRMTKTLDKLEKDIAAEIGSGQKAVESKPVEASTEAVVTKSVSEPAEQPKTESTGLEHEKMLNVYNDANKTLDEITAYVQKHKVSGADELIKSLAETVVEMKKVFDNQDYEKLKKLHAIFISDMEETRALFPAVSKPVEAVAKSEEPKIAADNTKTVKPKNPDKQESKKEREKMLADYNGFVDDFLNFVDEIKERIKTQKEKEFHDYRIDLGVIENGLKKMKGIKEGKGKEKGVKVFYESAKIFNDNLAKLQDRVDKEMPPVPKKEKKSDIKPIEPIADDLETSRIEADRMERVERELLSAFKELLKLYETKNEPNFKSAIEGLKLELLQERLKNKGKQFDEEADLIRTQIDGLQNTIIDFRKKKAEEAKVTDEKAKRESEEAALHERLKNLPNARTENPSQQAPEGKANQPQRSPERKKLIIDIDEQKLLAIVGEKKLQEVANELILGNENIATTLLKDIFSRADLDEDELGKILAEFNYSSVEFKKDWVEKFHQPVLAIMKKWVEQMSRQWLNKNINWWDKVKQNPAAHAKLAAINILPFAVLGGSISLAFATGGASSAARGAAVGGATGLLRGLKAKVDGIRGWFNKRKEKAQQEIVAGQEKIKDEKESSLGQHLLAEFSGEKGPETLEQLAAILSQSLRESSILDVMDKTKAGARAAIEEIARKIDVEFEKTKKTQDEELSKEVKRSQTERVESLINKLYEEKDLEALIQEVIERDPKIVKKLQGLNIYGLEFSKFVKDTDKDPAKKESNAKKIVSILASTTAGAGIGAALAAAPELRALLGAVVGGYMGVKYGHLKDRKARETNFEKEFKDNIKKAQDFVETWEKQIQSVAAVEFAGKNMLELSTRIKDLRVPLTFGMLDGDINLKMRAQNVLRRLESIQINIYLNETPQLDEVPAPENLRNSGVENLLTGLNEDLEKLTQAQQEIRQKILRKPGWWRAVGYGLAGALAGAGLGYGTAKLQEHYRGQSSGATHHPQPEHLPETAAPEISAHPVSPELPQTTSPLPPPAEVIPPLPETHRIDVVTLDDSEGVLHGGNKLMRLHPELFKHENGQPWTADEIHKWKVDELKEMGLKFKGDKWGYPMTVHGGAQVELFTDADGRPHFKLASDEHVTWHKKPRWVDTEPDTAESAAPEVVEPLQSKPAKPQFLAVEHTTLDRAHVPVESVVELKSVAPAVAEDQFAPFTEEKIAPTAAKTEVKVESEVKDKAQAVEVKPRTDSRRESGTGVETKSAAPVKKSLQIKPKTESVSEGVKETVKVPAPETVSENMSIAHFLKEHGSNPREFLRQYDNIIDATLEKLNSSMVFRGGSEKFLQSRIDALYNGTNGITFANLSSPNLADSGGLKIIGQVLDVEEKFRFHQPDWLRDFRLALFDKNDKAMGLALAPDRDVLIRPIMTNGGHAARIWDPTEGKDVFIYDKDRIFNTGANGELVMENEHGKIRLFNHHEALKMSEAP